MQHMLKAGVIGCGGIGGVHSEALTHIPEMDMVAYCDADIRNAQALRAQFGGDQVTMDPEDLLRRDDLDAIYICTWHDTHAPLAIRSLEAGKHVLVEKPLALCVEECLAVGEAVRASPAKLMTAFKMRYYDMITKARELMPEPLLVTMQMMDNPWGAAHWASDPVRGGGNVLSQGCHSCDILRTVAGSDPIDVYAVGGNYYTTTGVIDNLTATFRLRNGAAGCWVQGDAGCPPLTSKFFLQMFSQGASITLSDRLCTLTYQRVGEKPVVYRGTETGFQEENRAFVDCLLADTPPPIDHVDGLMATLMVLQAFRSIESGKPEPIASLIDR